MIGTIPSSTLSHYEPCPKCREIGRDTKGDDFTVYRDGSKHCFSCGFHHHRRNYGPFVPKIIQLNKDKLPADFKRAVPVKAFKWLLQYGLSYRYWREMIGWSEEHQRLVFLVGDPLQFSIGRSFDEENKAKPKWRVWGDCHKHVEAVGTGSNIVLVEDIISQHKVAQFTTSVALYGTKISPALMYYLAHERKPVVLWLDSDQKEHIFKRALNLQSIIGVPVTTITTDRDPKLVSNEDIQELLKEHNEAIH